MNPFARQAIEQIITERGEQLPALVFKNNAESQLLKDRKAYKFWRFVASMFNVFAMKAQNVGLNKSLFPLLPIGAVVAAIALSGDVVPLKTLFEDTTSPRWYVHGLIFNGDFDDLQQKLAPHNIKVMSRGCIVGDDEYKKDMQHNQRVYDTGSDDLKRLLKQTNFSRSRG